MLLAGNKCCNFLSPELRGKDDRQKFVIKVYAIVFAMLAFTSICVGVVVGDELKIAWC